MHWLEAALAVAVTLWTLLPLLRKDAWWVRIFDFPRLQIALIALAGAIVVVASGGLANAGDKLAVAVLLACAAYQLARIAAYTPFAAKQASDAENPAAENCISIFVANVLTSNRNADRLIEMVETHDCDLLLFVETDRWWQSKLDVLEAKYPYTVKYPTDNLYGMHLYSRFELVDPQLKFLIEDGVPSIHSDVILKSGRCVTLHCVHPSPPIPPENARSSERDAELLLVAKSVAEAGGSAIVFGDLNDVAWSGTTRLFQKISGLLDPRIGRGMFSTFHAKYFFLRWPLDHIFFSPDFELVSLERLGFFGSDHFPMRAVLCHVPAENDAKGAPSTKPEHRERAEEKLAKISVREEP